MKKLHYIFVTALSTLSLLYACETADVPDIDKTGKSDEHELRIHVSDFNITYSDIDTRGNRGNSRRISFVIINEDLENVFSLEQIEDSVSEFGNISCQLKSGRYTMMAIVHSSSSPVEITDNTVSFAEPSITDTFLAREDVILTDDVPLVEINMKARRVVALFSLTCQDELPDNIKSFGVTISKGYTTLNPQTGFSTKDKGGYYPVIVNPSDLGTKDYSFKVYTFLPSEEVSADITVKAIDTEGEEIKKISFNNVRLGINKKTDACGAFFVQRQAIGIDYDETWGSSELIEF